MQKAIKGAFPDESKWEIFGYELVFFSSFTPGEIHFCLKGFALGVILNLALLGLNIFHLETC